MPEVEQQVTEVEQPVVEAVEAKADPVKTEAAPETGPTAVEQKTEQPRDEKGKFKPALQSRIDELTRARHEAEREAAYWRNRANPEQPKAEPAKPTPEKFENYGDYVEALADWKAEEKVSAALKARDAEAAKTAEQKAVETRTQTFQERQQAARTAMPDYDAVVGAADVPITSHVAEALLDSEKGPELVYHLSKNPAEAERLNKLSPLAAARELGRIEATLSAPQKPVTKAPAPMKPSGGGTTAVTDPGKMSHDEYRTWRKGQGARWAS